MSDRRVSAHRPGFAAAPTGVAAIARFWAPLALTWLMMSIGQPLMATVVARLPEPVANLAAYGIAQSMAMVLEFPVVMLLSASTRLVVDCATYQRLHRFAGLLVLLVTALGVLLVATPAMHFIAARLIGVAPPIAERVELCMVGLIPWAGAIGYRRFIQGILIREGQTRQIAYGTVVRLVAVAGAGFAGALATDLDGAVIGAGAMGFSVTAECLATMLMARRALRDVKARAPLGPPPSYPAIALFYYPLALTSLLATVTGPLVAFFLGAAHRGLESLAVYPVVFGMMQVFRGMAMSYQEVVIALRGEDGAGHAALVRFAWLLGGAILAGMVLTGATPLGDVLFRDVAGLADPLARLAFNAYVAAIPLTVSTVYYVWQRAIMVHRRRTLPITVASALEIAATGAALWATVHPLAMTGIMAAVTALSIGRVVACLYLVPHMGGRGAALR